MFDNFTPEMTREAVRKVAGRCETESSGGGITRETMRLRRLRRRLHLGEGSDAPDQVARHVAQSLRAILGENTTNRNRKISVPAAAAALCCRTAAAEAAPHQNGNP